MTVGRVLITGGAGFIGTHLSRHLLQLGIQVRILDVLLPQVHGSGDLPSWMTQSCDVRIADIRDASAVAAAVDHVDAVVHLAAETGTGQSMYAMCLHSDVNVTGTATLLEALRNGAGSVRKVVVASSRAIYGEGRYRCRSCGPVFPPGRDERRLSKGLWDPLCPNCGASIVSEPTDEESATRPTSVYGTTKLAQELLVANFGRASGIPIVALRFQNVFGEGQSLSNPYTGILTHFFGAARNGQPPRVFEDGQESRDFVHVDDVARATVLALEADPPDPLAVNVGSGTRTTIQQLAESMCRVLNAEEAPVVVGEYRVGDIRHCVADLRRSAAALNYAPQVTLETGLRRFVDWALARGTRVTSSAEANEQLIKAGLLRSAGGR